MGPAYFDAIRINKMSTDLLRRFVIGNDPLISAFTNTVTTDNYPPHNLTQESETRFTIEIACAGFSQDDIAVSQKKNVLRIETKLETEGRLKMAGPFMDDPLYQKEWHTTVLGPASRTMPGSFRTTPEYPVKVHQGLAKRPFAKQWVLADGWKARGASMKNGILTVVVEYEKPKDEDTIPIEISSDERQTLKG